jgi:hypothetical protein
MPVPRFRAPFQHTNPLLENAKRKFAFGPMELDEFWEPKNHFPSTSR